MNEKRDAYVQKLKAQLDEWNADINKLEAKADQAEVRAKIEYHKRIADLRARRKEVEDNIGELQQAGEGAWEDLKQGLENSWEILKASFTKAKSEFERGYKEGREDSK
jgi:predicted RNase H-like nuclease (RuvC/YqgF family)